MSRGNLVRWISWSQDDIFFNKRSQVLPILIILSDLENCKGFESTFTSNQCHNHSVHEGRAALIDVLNHLAMLYHDQIYFQFEKVRSISWEVSIAAAITAAKLTIFGTTTLIILNEIWFWISFLIGNNSNNLLNYLILTERPGLRKLKHFQGRMGPRTKLAPKIFSFIPDSVRPWKLL